ncbi:MAG: GAF domain-containing protein [Chloroflexota bacterium]
MAEVARDAIARRDAVVRAAARVAAEPNIDGVVDELLREAVALVNANWGQVFRWDAGGNVMVSVLSTRPGWPTGKRLPLGTGAAGRAGLARSTVIINDYQGAIGLETAAGEAGAQASVATPLVRDDTLLGALVVLSDDPHHQFDEEDAAILELLGSLASSTMVGLETARRDSAQSGRLDGIALAGRELAHLLNNDLTAPIGILELVIGRADVPPRVKELLQTALIDLGNAERHIKQFQQVVRVETRATPVGPSLDLDRSTDTGK